MNAIEKVERTILVTQILGSLSGETELGKMKAVTDYIPLGQLRVVHTLLNARNNKSAKKYEGIENDPTHSQSHKR